MLNLEINMWIYLERYSRIQINSKIENQIIHDIISFSNYLRKERFICAYANLLEYCIFFLSYGYSKKTLYIK